MARTPKNEFGIEFGEPPVPARQNEDNRALWSTVFELLTENPGKWAKVKTWDKPGTAGTYASNVNNGRNKTFPNQYFEARYEATRNQDGSGSSSLWLCCTATPEPA